MANDADLGGLVDRLHRQGGAGMRLDDPAFVEQVLKLRASRLAQSRDLGDDKPPGIAVLCFRVGGEAYAVPLGELAEVMPLGAWTPVPGQPQQLLGVVNVRGEIRPVLDLHAMLTLPPPEAGGGYIVFLRAGGREIGLRVDGLDRIRFLDPDTLTRPHESANGLPQRFVAGITPDTLILLDPRQVLALEVLQDRRADYRRAI
ncbi:MAG TPA: chemotaxis protein CheW [Candidatus Omnitrophota bacterium]|nr:chemotaxis protein CheW [Candidatus Omnitrophota bacterium]